MEMTGNVLVLFCVGLAVVPGVQSACTDINAYNHLYDFLHNDKCESADRVFKYLQDMTHSWECRRDIINKLAGHFGDHAHTPDHCLCTGTFTLQDYSTSHTDGIREDLVRECWKNSPYNDMFHQFFHSNNQPHDLVCRTHHSIWTQLSNIYDDRCQKDFVYHISYAFSQHSDPCSCYEKYVTTTHPPSQHGQGHHHCDQFDSYKELASLVNHSICLSANTVWHLLNNLQKHDSGCRTHIQNLLLHSYNNVPRDGNDECVCTPKHTLTNKQHLHHTNDDQAYFGCKDREPGSTYSAIERDLFTNITGRGCRNHNYLWPALAGVKNHTGSHSGYHDCTQDLITRATMDYPSKDSDNCICVQQTTTLSTTKTTTTTTSTTHQTNTPAKTTTKSDDMTTPHEKYDATTHLPEQHGQLHDHCSHYKSYMELDNLMHNSKCMSANTVWHLLNDLQKQNSSCRTHIQHLLSESYNNVPIDGNNECECTPKHTLTNKQHLHYTSTNYDDRRYHGCSHEAGSTYSAIESDLFTHITDRGCRNHNYLWPTLTGVKNYYNNYIHPYLDCTLDLITRATMEYPSQDSDNCTCVQKTITSSMAMTTTTTTIATQQTTTPTTTTTTKSDVTTTLHGSTVVSYTTVSSHNEDGWESWSPWTCKITKSDLSATCHNFRQRHCLSNIGCEGSSSETMECKDSQCSDADITYVNCSVYNQYSTCEDQISCTYFSKTPWKICGDAAHVAQCPRLCTCCPIPTTSPTTTATQTTTPTTTTTTTTSSTTMTQSHSTTSSSICNFDCGLHGRCYNDGCHCSPGYQGNRCEQAITTSPTTTSTQTTTTPPKPEAVMTTLASTSTTMTETTPTASSATTIITDQVTPITQPRTTETTKSQQSADRSTTQQPSTTTSLPRCNHTCTLDAVILSTAVKNSKADNCSDKTSASNEALPMDCCNMGDQNSWTKGAQVQTNLVCTDGTPPPYTPIAAYNESGSLIPDTAGIFYGCIKDGKSGFMMIHQTCVLLPNLLHVDGTPGKDPNTYFMFY